MKARILILGVTVLAAMVAVALIFPDPIREYLPVH